MSLNLSDFYDTFFDEADELLVDMEQLLLGVDVGAPDPEQINAIFRAAHSIKGGAATFGTFRLLAETTHLLENLLDAVRRHELTLRADMIDVFLSTKDVLKDQLDAYRASTEPDPVAYEKICAALRALRDTADGVQSVAAIAVQAADNARVETLADASASTVASAGLPLRVRFRNVSPQDGASLKVELANLGTVLHVEDAADGCSVWLDTTCSDADVEAVCSFIINAEQMALSHEALPVSVMQSAGVVSAPSVAVKARPAQACVDPAKPAKRGHAADKESSSIRVGVEKVDQIINLVGELVITQAMLAQTVSVLDPVLHDRLFNGMEQLERNARDLQEAVMTIRMMPMDYVFSRFPRVVRDNAAKLGKQIDLQTHGSATELDKSLIERIIDPLTHLVRNSLDHGIETPDLRVAAGKPPVGILRLSAQHSGGNIVIEVSDDGKGLDRERLLKKAVEKGLPVSDNPSDEEVWQLIFAPGFSTADIVTDISGRGVGMDVVRRNIQAMGGHVQLYSRAGKGTTTRIVLPLTLAILDGMSVRVGGEIFVLPLSHVMESLQPEAHHIHSVVGNERVLHVRGEYLPLVELHKVFSVAGAQIDPAQSIAVILQAEDRRFALLVDQLVAQHQVVVKNLESNYRKVPGISAATILGDGSVALIVDVFALANVNREKWVQPEALLA